MKRIAIGVAVLAAIAAIATLVFLRHRDATAALLTPKPAATALPRVAPRSSANPRPSGSVRFLPELPPRELVPRKPSIFQAPAKAGSPPNQAG